MSCRLLFFIVLSSLVLGSFALSEAQESVADSSVGIMLNIPADVLVLDEVLELDVKTATPEQFRAAYRRWVDRFAGTRVKDLLLNVNFQRACFPSKTWDRYEGEGKKDKHSAWCGRLATVLSKGVDPYAICIRRCREIGISPWASIRMNDHHYLDDPEKSNRFWQAHPEYRIKGQHRYDYAHEAVRNHYLVLIEEVLEKYDIDGLELDWVRTLPTIHHSELEEGKTKLTDFMRQVREAADRVAKRRGRPIRIAVRVPTRPAVAQGFGLDVPTWIARGFVDTVIPCNFYVTIDNEIPLKQWRDLIAKTERPCDLAPGTDHRIQAYPGGPVLTSNLETLRGFSATMIGRGADRIYLFNHSFPSWYQFFDANQGVEKSMVDDSRRIIEEAGSLSAASSHPRLHALTFHDQEAPGTKTAKPLPASLTVESPADFQIDIGPKPTQGRAILQIGLGDNVKQIPVARLNRGVCKRIDDLKAADDPQALSAVGLPPLYGTSPAQAAPRIVQYEISLSDLRSGQNRIHLSLEAESDKDVKLRVSWCSIRLVPPTSDENRSKENE